MTWTKSDTALYDDDDAFGAVAVRVRENLRDTITNRTQGTAWGFLFSDPVVFSTSSVSWRSIPFIVWGADGYDTLSVRIRYELDKAGVSGISSGNPGMDVAVWLSGDRSAETAINVTTAPAEVTLTLDVGDNYRGAFRLGELHFRSRQGSAAGTVTIYDIHRRNLLEVDESSAFLTAGKTHLEIDLGSDSTSHAIHHVPNVETSATANRSHVMQVWPHLDGALEGAPFGDGTAQWSTGSNVKHVPAITIYGIEAKWVGDVSRTRTIELPDLEQIGAGQPVRSRHMLAILDAQASVYTQRARCLTMAPTQTGNGGFGAKVDARSTWTRVSGAIFKRTADTVGVSVRWLWCPKLYVRADETRFRVTLAEFGGSTTTETITAVAADACLRGSEFEGDLGTLHGYNTSTDLSRWGAADTGLPGDVQRLTSTTLPLVEYPSGVAVGDTCEVLIEAQDIELWVGAVLILERRQV